MLDTLGGGSVFSVFDLFSGFTQLAIHPDTIPLTTFCTPNGLYEWPRMRPGAAGAPAWFVSVMRLVTAGLDNILMHLDDAIGPDDCPLHHVATLATFFARLRLHKLKLSPDKSRIGAARVDFSGHVILADGVRPNDARVAALARMPMPTDINQLRSLLGGLSYYCKFLANMAHQIRPMTALLKKGAAFDFTSAMEDTVRALLAELAALLILVFPDKDAVMTRFGPSASIATPVPLASEPSSNKNSRMAPYAPSISAEPPSTMNRPGPLWNSKPDVSCGVLDASGGIYSVCTSSFSPTISASSKFARSERPNRAFNAGWNFFRPITSACLTDEDKKTLTPTSSPARPSLRCRRCLWRLRPDGSRRSWRLSHPRMRTHNSFLPRPWRGLGWAGPLAGYPSFGWAGSLTGCSGLGWATPDIRRLPDTPCPDTVSFCEHSPSSPSRDISPGALHNLRQ